jgi:hypothetical protein
MASASESVNATSAAAVIVIAVAAMPTTMCLPSVVFGLSGLSGLAGLAGSFAARLELQPRPCRVR